MLKYRIFNIVHYSYSYSKVSCSVTTIYFARVSLCFFFFFFFQAEDGIRDLTVTGVQTCALPIYAVVLDRFWWSAWIYGLAGQANKISLKTAIQAEAIHWRRIQPACLFLITDRKSVV